MQNSLNLTEAARSVILFKINGFTATKEISGYTASRVCAVGGHFWKIMFLPDRKNRHRSYSEADWIVFSVSLISAASGVAASFSCFLVDQNIGGRTSKEECTSSKFSQGSSVDVTLMTRGEVEKSGYLKDECVIAQCAITVLLSEPESETVAKATPTIPSSNLHEHFGDLLQGQKGADITFIISGECVAAHRCVLAARSPVFMAQLYGDMKEKASPDVEIKDMEVKVFRAMLRFIYTDRVPELDEEGEQSTVMAQHLLEAADRYGLDRLKKICVEKMCMSISVDTVATALALAEQHGCSNLKSRCMEFIVSSPQNLQAVAGTEGYKHLETSCPSVLTELLKLMLKGKK
ncbi:hypothetical protein BS78_10G221900 [Paspalum vaginatum]|nr:hypothetical protein BS78_10G221900 [Paspalum vaginatum]